MFSAWTGECQASAAGSGQDSPALTRLPNRYVESGERVASGLHMGYYVYVSAGRAPGSARGKVPETPRILRTQQRKARKPARELSARHGASMGADIALAIGTRNPARSRKAKLSDRKG